MEDESDDHEEAKEEDLEDEAADDDVLSVFDRGWGLASHNAST